MSPPAPPPAAALMQIVYGPFVARCVWAMAELGVPDLLAAQPRTAEGVAQALGLAVDPTERLLGAMHALGVTARDAAGRWTNGPLGELLRSGVPGSVRDYVRYAWNLPLLRAWDRVLDVLRTGEPAFALANGAPFFEYAQKTDRAFGASFDAAMTSLAAPTVAPVAAALRADRFARLVDVGGGAGRQLAAVLAAAPALRGTLFDLPEVVAGAPPILAEHGVADRCEIAGGSFFDAVPSGADAYLMRTVLHDWGDAEASRILARVAEAAPKGARLFLVEMVLPDGAEPHPGRMVDLHMMVALGGRERSLRSWRELLAGAGFSLVEVRPGAGPLSVLEALREA